MSLAPEEKITCVFSRSNQCPKHESASFADHRSCVRRFQKGGPSAVANFDAGVAGFEARAFRGLGVFTSTPVRLLQLRF